MKREILPVFFAGICCGLFFYSNPALAIDWEQWRIPGLEQGNQDQDQNQEQDYGWTEREQQREENNRTEALNLNDKGNRAYRAGNWRAAIDYYKKALRKSPDDRVIRKNLTNAQNALAREDSRRREEKEAQEREKKEASGLKARGDRAYRAGNYEEAVGYYQMALDKSPYDSGIIKKFTKAQKALAEEEARAGAAFEQDKKEMLSRFKGRSGGGLKLKGRQEALSNNVPAKVIKDLHNSVYWSLRAAGAISSNDYEAASDFADFADKESPGGDIELPAAPDVPSPVPAHPQVRLYQFIIKKVRKTVSELKGIDTNLEQAKEEKRKAEKKIELQKIKIRQLKQKKPEREKEDRRETAVGPGAEAQALRKEREETDNLVAAALAALDEAEQQDKEAAKNIALLNERKKEKEEDLNNLRQGFEAVEKQPGQAGKILKELKGGG